MPNTNSFTMNETINATIKFNKTQKKILSLLHENKIVTYNEIAKQLGIGRTTVWRNIEAMKKKAFFRRVCGDKASFGSLCSIQRLAGSPYARQSPYSAPGPFA